MKIIKIKKDDNPYWITINDNGRIECYYDEKCSSGTYITNIGDKEVSDVYFENNRLCIVIHNHYGYEFIERYKI